MHSHMARVRLECECANLLFASLSLSLSLSLVSVSLSLCHTHTLSLTLSLSLVFLFHILYTHKHFAEFTQFHVHCATQAPTQLSSLLPHHFIQQSPLSPNSHHHQPPPTDLPLVHQTKHPQVLQHGLLSTSHPLSSIVLQGHWVQP